MDMMVAVAIFVGAALIFYTYIVSITQIRDDRLGMLISNAEIISENLVGEGVPANWTDQEASIAGLLDSRGRLSELKLSMFLTVANNNYRTAKRIVGTDRDFRVSFVDRHGMAYEPGGVGAVGGNFTLADPDSIVTVNRFVAHNASLIRMVVNVW